MATNYPTLVTTRYTTAGAYIGQLIVPAPAVTPDTRIPGYIGVGSRFAVAKNQQLRRSFVYDAELTFSPLPPYTALLPFAAANDKSVSRIVKADGTEVKQNQWQFLKNLNTGKYDSVQISTEVFDNVTTYLISYQSIDRNVLDPFPVAEIREFMAVGNGPDANDYEEYTHFFGDFTIGSVVGGVLSDKMAADTGNDAQSKLRAVTAIAADAGNTGNGTVVHSSASAFNHDYNRFYTLRCVAAGGTSPTRTATFEWTAQATSSGNNNLPNTPLDPSVSKPSFVFSEATPASATQALELGLEMDLDWGGGGASNFAPGDVFTLNGQGPALIEVDERHANTNQYYEQGAITKSAGTGYAALSYAGTSEPNNTWNASYKVSCVAAADSSTKATVQVLRSGVGFVYTAKVGGTAYNDDSVGGPGDSTIGLVNPGVPNSPLSVSVSGKVVTVTLATDNLGNLVSTLAQVEAAVNATASCPFTVTTVGLNTSIATPLVTGTVDIAGASVSAGVGTTLSSELKVGSKIKFSTQPNSIYTVDSALAATSFTVSPAYTGSAVTASVLTGGANISVTANSTSVTGTGTTFLADGLVAGSRVKFSNQLTHVYVVASVSSETALTLTTPFTGTTSSTVSGTQPGADIIEVSAPMGKTVLGVNGTLSGTLAWAEYGERIGVSGTSAYSFVQAPTMPANPTMALSNGIVLTLDLQSGPFIVGDTFSFKVLAPRQFYQMKDDRAVTLTTDAATNPGVGSGAVTLSYTTNTPEGGFGIVTPAPEDNSYAPSSASWKHGWFIMNGNINCAVRNMHGGPTVGTVVGTGTISNTGTAVTGSGTEFDTQLAVGDYITASGQTVRVSAITSATALTTAPAFSPAVAGASFTILRSGNRHVAGNKFTFSATMNGTINWSLVSKTTETIAKGSILTDVLGVITGAAATPYVILANVPETDGVLSVTEAVSGLPLSYSLVTTSSGDPTQYLVFLGGKPTVDVRVQYIYKGAEPAPGQIYYVTSKHVRPDELYNQPILIRSLDDGRKLLAPAEVTNHLYIMNEIAMGDVACPAIYIVQVKDADGDGVYSDVDFADGIAASEAPRNISDIVVLSHFSTLSKQLESVNKMADPFKRRFRMTWVGAPIGTAIGSEEEANTLIALSRRTLQVYGANPAHGTRVLVGATSCTRDLKLENNVVTEVTLDGSFVAGALAALVASFADPADTVLRKSLPGFKSVQTYGDSESPNNLALGSNNIIFFTDQGGGVFRIEEDVTTDTFAPDFNLINNMTQKMYVVKQVRQELDSKLIGLIVPSAEAGVGLVRGFLVQMLATLLGRGLIGRYQKADGSERPIDPSKDVIVFRDTSDPTLYHILFAFWLKNEIKRIFGLYSVNSNDFGG
jgi:hypothetical protein